MPDTNLLENLEEIARGLVGQLPANRKTFDLDNPYGERPEEVAANIALEVCEMGLPQDIEGDVAEQLTLHIQRFVHESLCPVYSTTYVRALQKQFDKLAGLVDPAFLTPLIGDLVWLADVAAVAEMAADNDADESAAVDVVQRVHQAIERLAKLLEVTENND